ncbi:hypothetical protein [Vibrio palustris]|uniref:MSHA biogenesis protein MshF n=1 Tax=Vibrio palustris TaxID=1918946 RepID=A0A1R4B7K0_9VIBR|nr:hypothetical protein [Vibrio palustris]SJL84894.1 hypothetical protein VPAL9027_02897 [Vibrio palustris]
MIHKAKLVMLMVLVIAFVFVFLYQAKNVEEKAKTTAFHLAVSQMNARAVRIKQLWILKKKPAMLEFSAHAIDLNRQGWPLLDSSNRVSCRDLLIILHPKIKILKFSPTIKRQQVKYGYRCLYIYDDINKIQVSLEQHGLSIVLTD